MLVVERDIQRDIRREIQPTRKLSVRWRRKIEISKLTKLLQRHAVALK